MAIINVTERKFSEKKVRPDGYEFPAGLNFIALGGALANVATNTTGGTQTTDGTDGSPTQNTIHTFTTSGTFAFFFKHRRSVNSCCAGNIMYVACVLKISRYAVLNLHHM